MSSMGLLELPQELLVRVSALLTVPDLGNLRRTCKHVEMFLFDDFVREFFTKRQFMLEEPSLQALVDISNHTNLSSRLTEVIIGLQQYPTDPDYRLEASKERQRFGYVNSSVLLNTGRACEMLVEAFSKLPNLRTVCLRDYDARGRPRGGHPFWRSYGWSWGLSPVRGSADPFTAPDTVFPMIMYALGRAGARPEVLAVILRGPYKLTPASFEFLTSTWTMPTVSPVLSLLKALTLTVGLEQDDKLTNTVDPPSGANNVEDFSCANLKRLLYCLPALESLRLNFEQHQSVAHRFLDWLGSSPSDPSSNTTIPPVVMPNLTTLDLGMLNVAPAILLRVIAKYNVNLKTLSLWKVQLHCENPDQLEDLPTRWESLLMDISRLPLPKLSYVLVGEMSQAYHSTPYRTDIGVYLSQLAGPKQLFSKAIYDHSTGSGIKEWFSQTASRTCYGLDSDSDSESDSEDSEEDEE